MQSAHYVLCIGENKFVLNHMLEILRDHSCCSTGICCACHLEHGLYKLCERSVKTECSVQMEAQHKYACKASLDQLIILQQHCL